MLYQWHIIVLASFCAIAIFLIIRLFINRSRQGRTTVQTKNFWRSFQTTFSSIWTSQRDIPRQLLHILSKMESGELGLHFHLDKLARLVNTLDNSSNRLTTGIIVAALIVGSSMIITTGVGPFIFGFPALGVIGYCVPRKRYWFKYGSTQTSGPKKISFSGRLKVLLGIHSSEGI